VARERRDLGPVSSIRDIPARVRVCLQPQVLAPRQTERLAVGDELGSPAADAEGDSEIKHILINTHDLFENEMSDI
jgi:hypothetical protein